MTILITALGLTIAIYSAYLAEKSSANGRLLSEVTFLFLFLFACYVTGAGALALLTTS